MSSFDENPADSKSELDLCINEIEQLQAELERYKAAVGLALMLDDVDSIKDILQPLENPKGSKERR